MFHIMIMRSFFIIAILLLFCASPSFADAKHRMVGPVKGKISSPFGLRKDPFTGKWRKHDGIDIAAPYGTPVYAIQEGRVTFSGWKGGYGKCVIIDHYYPDIPKIPRLQTKYGHNSKLVVRKGDYVKRGDLIAYVGSTGRSTGPHLHFEVVYHGKPTNPIDYIKKLPSYLDYVAYVREKETRLSRLSYKNSRR